MCCDSETEARLAFPPPTLEMSKAVRERVNVYRNAEPEELAGLHPSDRLMVQLIKIERLGPRIEGMLYKRTFEDTWSLLDDVGRFDTTNTYRLISFSFD